MAEQGPLAFALGSIISSFPLSGSRDGADPVRPKTWQLWRPPMRRLVAGITFFLLTGIAIAQSTFRGGLSGIVSDTQGGIIPAATIQATNSATGLVYKSDRKSVV